MIYLSSFSGCGQFIATVFFSIHALLPLQQSALEEQEEKPTLAACDEDAPEKSADPPEPEKQDDLPPTEVKRSVSRVLLCCWF